MEPLGRGRFGGGSARPGASWEISGEFEGGEVKNDKEQMTPIHRMLFLWAPPMWPNGPRKPAVSRREGPAAFELNLQIQTASAVWGGRPRCLKARATSSANYRTRPVFFTWRMLRTCAILPTAACSCRYFLSAWGCARQASVLHGRAPPLIRQLGRH